GADADLHAHPAVRPVVQRPPDRARGGAGRRGGRPAGGGQQAGPVAGGRGGHRPALLPETEQPAAPAGQRDHRRGSRGERLCHGERPGRSLGVPVLRTAPERVGHRGRPGRMFPSRQPERSLLMRWVRAGRPLTSEAEHERRAAGAGPNAASLRADAPPAPRLCWSGGPPPDPRASRTARLRASGTTMRCASRSASGTTSREGGRRCERGSISVELVVLAPGLALLLLLIAAGARVVEVQGHIDGAARDAARAASAARSYTEAVQAAQQAAPADLGTTSLCAPRTLRVRGAGHPAAPRAATPGAVTVTVTCAVNMSPFTALGFGLSKRFTGKAVAPLAPFMCRNVAC